MPDVDLHPIVELTKSRLRELLREPEIIFWVFAFPILMALALGIAFRARGAEDVPVAVVEGPGAAEMRVALEAADGLLVRPLDGQAPEVALRDGRVQLVVLPGTPPAYLVDPARAESRLARALVDAVLQEAEGRRDIWRAAERHVTAAGARYIDWLIPGLLGMNLMGTGLWGIGFSIVNARMKKLLKRLMATPMRRSHYLISHLLARLVFLALEVGALVGFARLVFGVPIRGSLLSLGVVALSGALAFGGLGLLLASRARTIEMISGLLNLVMLPMWIFSGVFFSYENFPEAIHPLIRILPLTALNDALRGVMLEGRAATALTAELGVLGFWGGACFLVALRIFRWR